MKIILICIFIMFLIIEKTIYSKVDLLMSPGFIMSLIWTFILIVYLLFDDGVYPYYGIVYISIALILFSFAHRMGNRIKTRCYYKIQFSMITLERYVFVIGMIMILIYLERYITSGGVQNTSKVAAEYYSSTKELSIMESIINQILSILEYSTIIFAGIISSCSNMKKKVLISLYVFIPPILAMLTTSGKLSIIVTLILWITGIFVGKIYYEQKIDMRFYIEFLKKGWKYVLALTGLLFVSFLLRYGAFSEEYINLAKNRMVSYAFGSPAAFNYWFIEYPHKDLSLGRYTFTAIAKVFRLATSKKGAYDELLMTKVWETNVFTIFRALVEDYGMFGGLLFSFIGGLISGIASKSYIDNKSFLGGIVMSMTYLACLFSVFNSPFVYMNLTIAIPMSFLICVIISTLSKYIFK